MLSNEALQRYQNVYNDRLNGMTLNELSTKYNMKSGTVSNIISKMKKTNPIGPTKTDEEQITEIKKLNESEHLPAVMAFIPQVKFAESQARFKNFNITDSFKELREFKFKVIQNSNDMTTEEIKEIPLYINFNASNANDYIKSLEDSLLFMYSSYMHIITKLKESIKNEYIEVLLMNDFLSQINDEFAKLEIAKRIRCSKSFLGNLECENVFPTCVTYESGNITFSGNRTTDDELTKDNELLTYDNVKNRLINDNKQKK